MAVGDIAAATRGHKPTGLAIDGPEKCTTGRNRNSRSHLGTGRTLSASCDARQCGGLAAYRPDGPAIRTMTAEAWFCHQLLQADRGGALNPHGHSRGNAVARARAAITHRIAISTIGIMPHSHCNKTNINRPSRPKVGSRGITPSPPLSLPRKRMTAVGVPTPCGEATVAKCTPLRSPHSVLEVYYRYNPNQHAARTCGSRGLAVDAKMSGRPVSKSSAVRFGQDRARRVPFPGDKLEEWLEWSRLTCHSPPVKSSSRVRRIRVSSFMVAIKTMFPVPGSLSSSCWSSCCCSAIGSPP